MIKIEGNAKINLTLDILGKRPDGYHEVAMVMQSIGLHDTMGDLFVNFIGAAVFSVIGFFLDIFNIEFILSRD